MDAAEYVRKQLLLRPDDSNLQIATVTDLSATTGTVTIKLGGSDVPVPARHLGSYNPQVNDTVVAYQQGADLLVLGTTKRVKADRDFELNPITSLELADGAVIAAKIAENAVNVANIVDGAVARVKIAEAAINEALIDTGAITETKIDDNAITTNKISSDAILTRHILAGQIDTFHLTAGAVTADKIASRTITADRIATNAITANEILAGTITAASAIIADATITNAKIANFAVTTAKIADAAITNANIANAAITNVKIANAAITTAKIDDLTVTSIKIANAAITNAKIANAAITTAKIANAAITNAKIDDLAVTNAKIANAQVTNAKIADAAITEAKIANAAITNAKIANAAITTAKIGNAAITNAKIDSLSASKITAGTITATISITSPTITGGSISGADVSVANNRVVLNNNGITLTPDVTHLSARIKWSSGKYIIGTGNALDLYSDGSVTFQSQNSTITMAAGFSSAVLTASGNFNIGHSILGDTNVNVVGNMIASGIIGSTLSGVWNSSIAQGLHWSGATLQVARNDGTVIHANRTNTDGDVITVRRNGNFRGAIRVNPSGGMSLRSNSNSVLVEDGLIVSGNFSVTGNTILGDTYVGGDVIASGLIGSTTDNPITGTTTGIRWGSHYLAVSRSGGQPLNLNRTSSNGHIIQFRRDGSNVGNVSVTTSGTTYNTASDYRLKQNERPILAPIDRLMALKPYTFNFVATPDQNNDGFFAHEAAQVVPQAVTGEKDAVDEDGNIDAQGIDQSKLVPLLTGALQELVTRVEILETASAN